MIVSGRSLTTIVVPTLAESLASLRFHSRALMTATGCAPASFLPQ